ATTPLPSSAATARLRTTRLRIEESTLSTDLNALVDQQASTIKKLEARLQRLEDIEAINVLQRTYGYLLDKGLWEDMADLFTENGTIEIGGRGVYVGRKRIHPFLRDVMGKGSDGL